MTDEQSTQAKIVEIQYTYMTFFVPNQLIIIQ